MSRKSRKIRKPQKGISASDNAEFLSAMETIRVFRVTYGDRSRPKLKRVTDKAICARYGIDRRVFSKRIEDRNGKHAQLLERFFALANAIKRDGSAVATELLANGSNPPIAPIPPESDANRIIQEAVMLAGTEDVAASVQRARRALSMACRDSVDALPQVMPQALYILMRHGPPMQMVHVIQHDLMRRLQESPNLKLPTAEAAAAIAQLACLLNESGHPREALNLFQGPAVQALAAAGGGLAWCGPMVLRNEAHAWVWGEHAKQRAMDCAESAASRSLTETNQQSVANTRSEIALHCGQYAEAWEELEPHYGRIREQLLAALDESTGDFVHPLPLRFQSSFGTLLFAMFAQHGMRDARYRPQQQEEDLRLIEAMLLFDESGMPWRPMLHGGVATKPKIHIPDRLLPRMERLYAVTLKPRLEDWAVESVLGCVNALKSAAGI